MGMFAHDRSFEESGLGCAKNANRQANMRRLCSTWRVERAAGFESKEGGSCAPMYLISCPECSRRRALWHTHGVYPYRDGKRIGDKFSTGFDGDTGLARDFEIDLILSTPGRADQLLPALPPRTRTPLTTRRLEKTCVGTTWPMRARHGRPLRPP